MKRKREKGLTSSGKAPSNPRSEELKGLLDLMKSYGLAELEWEKAGERIVLKTQGAFVGGGTYVAAPQAPAFAGSYAAAPSAPASAQAAPAESSRGKTVVSPFVGTFFRAPSPGSEPYSREGQIVKAGDVLCIVEAMKLMNEIEAEFSGKIVQILIENGQPVEFGEPLFIIEPV